MTAETPRIPTLDEQAAELRQARYLERSARAWPMRLLLAAQSRLTDRLLRWGVDSRAVTTAWFVVALVAYAVIAIGQPWAFILGALLLFVKTILDICDGELGRYQKRFRSEAADVATHMQGLYLDRMCHAVENPIAGVAVGWGVYRLTGSGWAMAAGIAVSALRALRRVDPLLRPQVREPFAARIEALRARQPGAVVGATPRRRAAPLWDSLLDTAVLWVGNSKRFNYLLLILAVMDWIAIEKHLRPVALLWWIAACGIVSVLAIARTLWRTQRGDDLIGAELAAQAGLRSGAAMRSEAAHSPDRPRVLMVNPWSSCHGGSSTSLLDLVRYLDRARFEPVALCPEPGELPERLDRAGVRVVLHPLTSFKRGKILPFLGEVVWYWRFLRREQIDVVHLNGVKWRPSLALAARLASVPFIQHVRNPIEHVDRNFAFRWAHAIITNSTQVADPLRSVPELAAKTRTIYNAVDLSRYDAVDNHRAEISPHGEPIVGFVGQIVPRKGLDTLIDALAIVRESIPRAKLVIVGCAPPGEEHHEATYRAQVATLGLNDAVQFIGFRDDVPAWMRSFDVFALPTRSEPFGKVVIEAMAAGCPVVAAAVGGIPEIVTSDDLGRLVPPDDPKATARAIVEFLSDQELAARVGASGKSEARRRFGVEMLMQQMEATYRDALG